MQSVDYKQIQPLRLEHAAEAARLHYEGQRHTFLGQMGQPFLAALYREMIRSPWAFGMVAVEEGQVVGVGVAALDTERLFRDLILRGGPRLLGPALAAFWRKPRLLRHALETLTYPKQTRHREDGAAELLFVGVDDRHRGRGIATRLTDERIRECRRRGYHVFVSLVELNNEISTHLQRRRGYEVLKVITLYGRQMAFYRLDLRGQADPTASLPTTSTTPGDQGAEPPA